MNIRMQLISLAVVVVFSSACWAVTGNPLTDGWAAGGNSLANGTYVEGSANYGFATFGAGFSITAGSNLEITDGGLSWLAGDTVVGVGGIFESITASEAGWSAISGTAVNGLIPTSSPYVGPRLQVKFGTSAATWTTSTTAPGSGNASGSSSLGGGRVQVRTSGYFQTGTPNPGQTEPWTWDGNSGQVLVLDKDDHISWDGDGSLDKRVARMIWQWDDVENQVGSWELLLNVSLLQRVAPTSYAGLFPEIGDKAIMTVQNGDNAYTNALIQTTAIPEPASLTMLMIGGVMVLRRRHKG